MRRYCTIQIWTIYSSVPALILVLLLDNPEIVLVILGFLSTASALFAGPVVAAPFLPRRLVVTTMTGHALLAAGFWLWLAARAAALLRDFELGDGFVVATSSCLLVALPLTTIGLVRLLCVLAGTWHAKLGRELWTCFGLIWMSLVLHSCGICLESSLDVERRLLDEGYARRQRPESTTH